MSHRARSIFLLAVICLAAAGCSKTTGRKVDVSKGEYYAEDELLAMSNAEREAYCKALEAERTRVQSDLALNQEDLVNTRKQIDSFRNQITPVEKEILRVEADIRTLSGQIAALERLPREYTVKEGDCLSIIADRDDIYAAASKWPRIYRANLDKIEDPVWIYPNMVLVVPRELPTEHRVAPFETLEMIAGYWEVYGDPAQWTRLYEANKDKVSDPTNLEPNILLTIPR
ncbi:MAG TPA: LysM peptidoglycan-binding domain-containing protein [Candidatus Krumholzibacteria bacterium]|nr:LysM peptidoglycan-binding domain-containing protein [Candidatus Krumholzibacteria bacterium]